MVIFLVVLLLVAVIAFAAGVAVGYSYKPETQVVDVEDNGLARYQAYKDGH